MKRALITGISGQDGYYLAQHLQSLKYRVFGLIRPESPALSNIKRELPQVSLLQGDLKDKASILAALEASTPHEVYNLAALGLGPGAFQNPSALAQVNALGAVNLLEAALEVCPQVRLFQASSSEMYAGLREMPVTEDSPLQPQSYYGASKAYAHWMVGIFRKSRGLFACCGILFNHESPRRQAHFVFRKVTQAAARIKVGLQDNLTLGNLEARRDWGFALDYVQAMHLTLQQEEPKDYVIATGKSHSIRELAEAAFRQVGLDWQRYANVDTTLLRPSDAKELVGDPSKTMKELVWKPTVDFHNLVKMLVEADLMAAEAELSDLSRVR